jgi:hypothetical protein
MPKMNLKITDSLRTNTKIAQKMTIIANNSLFLLFADLGA